MHRECLQFLRELGSNDPLSVIEIGSRDINGSARAFWPNAQWIGLDLHAGPAVDVVCDAQQYVPAELVDMVVCCEVLEHAANWGEILTHAASWLKPTGRIIVTCAGPGRAEHSAIDGKHRLLNGEHYRNLTASEVSHAMRDAGLGWIEAEQVGEDIQAIGWKQGPS